MHRIFLKIYIYSLPFSWALTLGNGVVTLSIMISAIMFTLLPFINRKNVYSVEPYNTTFLTFLLYLLLLLLSLLINAVNLDKQLAHYVAYVASIILFGYIPLSYIKHINLKKCAIEISLDLIYITRFVCSIAVIEFIGLNIFDFDLMSFIPNPDGGEWKSMFLGELYRARGFFAEPGHLSFFLEIFIPISLAAGHYIRSQNCSYNSWLNILYILGILVTGTPVGIGLMFVSYLLSKIFYNNKAEKNKYFTVLAIGFAIYTFSAWISSHLENNESVFNIIKMIYDQKVDSSSSDVRIERLEIGTNLFFDSSLVEFFFGYGPAVYFTKNLDGTVIQFYMLLLLESGILGTLAFFFGLYIFYGNGVRVSSRYRQYFAWSFISAFFHYFLISNYYYPYFWFLFAVSILYRFYSSQYETNR